MVGWRKVVDRMVVAFGAVSRILILLLLLVYPVLVSFLLVDWRSITPAAAAGILVRVLLLAGVLVWIFRKGPKPYRGWAVAGATVAAIAAAGPCWLPDFPGQDFAGPRQSDRNAVVYLREIQAAESRFHARFHRYADLPELVAAQEFPSERPGFPHYVTRVAATATGYRLTNVPYPTQTGYGCCIGCPRMRFFVGDETGILRADSHCRPANAHSAVVK